jgi:hypothetical protein
MLGQSLWHWALFAVTALFWIAVPLVARWERRQDARDREIWKQIQRGGSR